MSNARLEPGTTHPTLVVLDVNETLSDLSGMEDAFREVGLDERDVGGWFTGVLRDAFALTVLGDNPSFAELGSSSLQVLLTTAGAEDPAAAAQQVMSRFAQLRPHPDVVPGLVALAEAGCRIVTFSNGSDTVARALLEDTEAGSVIEAYLSVSGAGAWKPTARAYRYVLEHTSVAAADAMLVAVHPWDLEGAHRAGLRTAWINRGEGRYPDHFSPPDLEAGSMVDVAAALAGPS